jgi:S-adenosylmethionine:tRNA-ribosyltransferase-isomerase (queuine synthetase)
MYQQNRIGRTLFKTGTLNGVLVKKEENRKYSDEIFYQLIELSDKCVTMNDLLTAYNEIYTISNNLEKLKDAMKNKIKVRLREMNRNDYFDNETQNAVSLNMEKKVIWDMEKVIKYIPSDKIDILKKTISYEKFHFVNKERRKQLEKFVKKNIVSLRQSIEGDDENV